MIVKLKMYSDDGKKTIRRDLLSAQSTPNKAGLTPILARITTNGVYILVRFPPTNGASPKSGRPAKTNYVSRSILIWTITVQGFLQYGKS